MRGHAWTWPGSRVATPSLRSQSRGGRGRASRSPVGSGRARWGEKGASIPPRQSPSRAVHAHPCLSFPRWSHPDPLVGKPRLSQCPTLGTAPWGWVRGDTRTPRAPPRTLGPHLPTVAHTPTSQGTTSGALREALCTSPTKITFASLADVPPEWHAHPGVGSPDGLAGFPGYRRRFPLIQRKFLCGGRRESMKAGSASPSPSLSRRRRHAEGLQGPPWAQYPPPQPRG